MNVSTMADRVNRKEFALREAERLEAQAEFQGPSPDDWFDGQSLVDRDTTKKAYERKAGAYHYFFGSVYSECGRLASLILYQCQYWMRNKLKANGYRKAVEWDAVRKFGEPWGYGERQTRHAFNQLVAKGYIVKVHRKGQVMRFGLTKKTSDLFDKARETGADIFYYHAELADLIGVVGAILVGIARDYHRSVQDHLASQPAHFRHLYVASLLTLSPEFSRYKMPFITNGALYAARHRIVACGILIPCGRKCSGRQEYRISSEVVDLDMEGLVDFLKKQAQDGAKPSKLPDPLQNCRTPSQPDPSKLPDPPSKLPDIHTTNIKHNPIRLNGGTLPIAQAIFRHRPSAMATSFASLTGDRTQEQVALSRKPGQELSEAAGQCQDTSGHVDQEQSTDSQHTAVLTKEVWMRMWSMLTTGQERSSELVIDGQVFKLDDTDYPEKS